MSKSEILKIEIGILKKEIEQIVHRIQCPSCNKLLAKKVDNSVIIRCGRCKTDVVLK